MPNFESTYVGKLASELATIQEGRRLMELLQTAAPKYRGGMGLPETSLIAIGGKGGMQSLYLPVKELLEDGISVEQPIHLQLKIEQGPDRPTGDDFGDETIHPFRTVGGIMLEVRDTLDVILSQNESGYIRVFTEIARAAGTVPLKIISTPVEAPPAPPNFDPPPVHGHNDDGTAKKKK